LSVYVSVIMNVCECVIPVMNRPSVQGVFLPTIQDAGQGSNLPTTLHRTSAMDGWILWAF